VPDLVLCFNFYFIFKKITKKNNRDDNEKEKAN